MHWREALVTTTWWVAKLPMLWRCGILHRISAHNSAKDRVVNVQEYTASSEIVIRRDLRMHYFPGLLGVGRHSTLSRGTIMNERKDRQNIQYEIGNQSWRWLLVATTWWVAPSLPFKRLQCLKQKLATVLLRQTWPIVVIWFGKLKTHPSCYLVDNKMSKGRCFCIRWTVRRDSRCWGQAPWRYGRVICTRPCPTELIRLFRTLSSFIREPSSLLFNSESLELSTLQQ